MHKMYKISFGIQNIFQLHFFAFFCLFFAALSVMKGMESPSESATNPIPIRYGKKNSPNRKVAQKDKDKKTVNEVATNITKDAEFLESLEPNQNFFELFAKKLLDNDKFATLVQKGCNDGETELERLLIAYERAMNLYERIMDKFLAKWRFINKEDQKKIELISKYKVKKQWQILNKWKELKKHLLDQKGVFGSPPSRRGKEQKKPQTFWEFNDGVKERIKIDLMELIRTKSEQNCTCKPCTEMQEMAQNISEKNANGENWPAKVLRISPQNSRVYALTINERNEKR